MVNDNFEAKLKLYGLWNGHGTTVVSCEFTIIACWHNVYSMLNSIQSSTMISVIIERLERIEDFDIIRRPICAC